MPVRAGRMDAEAAFFRVHARLSGVLSQVLTPNFRRALEYTCLFNAFALLVMLVVMHVSFVGQVRRQASCFSGPQLLLHGIQFSNVTNSVALNFQGKY